MLKKAIINKAQCAECKDIIMSRTRHDFVSCSCGAIFVDGGTDYLRRGGSDGAFIDMSRVTEYDDRQQLENSDVFVNGVHSPALCEGNSCPIHNRSLHPLRDCEQALSFINHAAVSWRICTHGIYHIDPDESKEWLTKNKVSRKHKGCDGCCKPTT